LGEVNGRRGRSAIAESARRSKALPAADDDPDRSRHTTNDSMNVREWVCPEGESFEGAED